MTEPQGELLDTADRIDQLVNWGRRPEVQEPLDTLQEACEEVGKAWSGSWLGYHANVYYEGLTRPPPGAHFSQEWGSMQTFSNGTTGGWVEFDAEQVEAAIRESAGSPNMEPAHALCDEAVGELEAAKMLVLSNVEPWKSSDTFLKRLGDELDKVSIAGRADVVKALMPTGKFMTRDSIATGQGFWTPPHFSVLSEVLAIRHAFDSLGKLGKLARQAGSHIMRRKHQQRTSKTVGTNVFIGHGRSPIWRELKDFIEDRLMLPVDDCNRVPVAGITNIARLSEMMDAAVFALLVLTGEDEQPDGDIRARMNVIHEAGLFQGRLGFTRAIILLEDECDEFSNIQGLGQISISKK